MTTPLAWVDLGPVSLLAPDAPARHVRGTYGQLWQWNGDGTYLHTLSVAVRRTRLGTPTGVRHHLQAEVDAVCERLGAADRPALTQQVDLAVGGSTGTASTDVVGERHGAAVRHRVVVTTDGEHMHVTQVVVPESDDGRLMTRRVVDELAVRTWTMPS